MSLLEKEKPADPEKPEVCVCRSSFISIFFIFIYLSELKV